jgi:hypothetical protein
MKILALDLGKFKTRCSAFDTKTRWRKKKAWNTGYVVYSLVATRFSWWCQIGVSYSSLDIPKLKNDGISLVA